MLKKTFKLTPFKNPRGAPSWRVSGWSAGLRIRRNFKTREEAAVEMATLEIRALQATAEVLRRFRPRQLSGGRALVDVDRRRCRLRGCQDPVPGARPPLAVPAQEHRARDEEPSAALPGRGLGRFHASGPGRGKRAPAPTGVPRAFTRRPARAGARGNLRSRAVVPDPRSRFRPDRSA